MQIYGFHDAKRVINAIVPLARYIIGFIALTLFLDIFFAGMRRGEEMQNLLIAQFAVSTGLSYVVMSFFLGRIIEGIFGTRPLSAPELIKKHLPVYLLTTLILIIIVTPIFVILSALFFPQNNQALFFTIMITLKILPIYIFPLAFITGQPKHAVFTGIKCLFGNVSDSLFLIFLSVLVFLFEGTILPALLPAIGNNTVATAVTVICNIFFSLYIFTAAAWVTKEKIYSDEGPEGDRTLH
ncbi:hypothetical protein [Desulfoluna sp.]|uniref:hypothetical protein n=1 Tax=Desulfoluna sp. TaxID=2045199 RepID=UPI00261CD504|nr:hypothetical protein [Desulfoluna sp.]